MKRTKTLEFIRPVDDGIPIIPGGGEYGASRPYGSHSGVDFPARRERVRTVEGGRVVYSDNRAGSENKANYGNVIVIDHTPGQEKTSAIYIPSTLTLTAYQFPAARTLRKGAQSVYPGIQVQNNIMKVREKESPRQDREVIIFILR